MQNIQIRAAMADDVPLLERRCWREKEEEMYRRIDAQGTCSIIALDGDLPVAQLYLRLYQHGHRAPGGMMDGSWWADFKGLEDDAETEMDLPDPTLVLGCWHVGRVLLSDGSEKEAEQYRGRGLGIALFEGAMSWCRSRPEIEALAAKATDSAERSYIGWVGGLPLSAYEELGFTRLATFDDPYFLAEPERVPETAIAEHPARFHLVRWENA